MKNLKPKQLSILALSDKLDLLEMLENQFSKLCPHSWFDKANSFYMGAQYMASYSYDSVVLDANMLDGYCLMVRALDRKIPLLVIVDNDKTYNAFEQLMAIYARSIISKNNLNEINLAGAISKTVLSANTGDGLLSVFKSKA